MARIYVPRPQSIRSVPRRALPSSGTGSWSGSSSPASTWPKRPARIDSISTGAINLDAAIGIGGIPRGRITEIYGPESSGKTTLCLHAIANVQKTGGVAAFVDAEHALDIEYARKLGVDVDNLLVSQPDTGEQALEIAEALVPFASDHVKALDAACTRRHRKLFGPPRLPAEYTGDVDLARLAVESPYACYLRKAGHDSYEWDFRDLGRYRHKEGLHSLGVHVQFRMDREQRLHVALEQHLAKLKELKKITEKKGVYSLAGKS